MTITQLKYIITISENGSLNKAAEVLFVSQPSLTSAVRELEKELGITLLNRGGKGVTLTNDGAVAIGYRGGNECHLDWRMKDSDWTLNGGLNVGVNTEINGGVQGSYDLAFDFDGYFKRMEAANAFIAPWLRENAEVARRGGG